MTASEELRHYLGRLHGRLRLGAVLRGAALLAAAALGATLVLVVFANARAFSADSVRGARAVLIAVLVAAAAAGLVMPLLRLTRRRGIARAERTFPRFGQRLSTFDERDAQAARDPFLELLAQDSLHVAAGLRRPIVPAALLAGCAGVGAASLGLLLWLIHSGPGYLGYGAALLWRGPSRPPLYQLRVMPGDATIRRHADFVVTAQPVGMSPAAAVLHLRYRSGQGWQSESMQPAPRSTGFRYLVPAVPEDAQYYVEMGPLTSARFTVHVADFPAVQQVRATYHYPAWTHLPDRRQQGGDLQAVQGSQAVLEVQTDQPLNGGQVVTDDGRALPLTPVGRNLYRASVPMDRDATYHLAARDGARELRISGDYLIEATAPKPPQVAIVRPRAEYQASPIEEVTVAAQAGDEFGLDQFTLRYSVNGAPEHSVNLLKAAGSTQARGTVTLSLEDLKLVPGDVVSVYAQARDGHSEARSDMLFVEAQPFEREFSQSQQGGAGGGPTSDQAEISRREKEIIAGTWNQVGAGGEELKQAEQAKFLADAQEALRAQALSLAGRLQMRGIDETNEQFGSFEQEMAAAATAMAPAAEQLRSRAWRAAVPQEQKALQHLLRAEATFREIQVAFGSAAGGAGGGSMGRDLASLSDLELDTQKNQYETAPDAQSGNPDRRIDDALKRLDELAQQQEQLAAQPVTPSSAAEQRWQQEMLRRNAQELARELQQLGAGGTAQSGAQQAGQADQSGQSAQAQSGRADRQAGPGRAGQPGQPSQPGNSGQADGSPDPAVRDALARLQRAQEQMSRAGGHDAAAAGRAAEELRAAMDALGTLRQRQSVAGLDELARRAAQLAGTAHSQAGQLRQLLGGSSAPGNTDAMVDARQHLADELAQFTQALRASEQETLQSNRRAAGKLRDALRSLDDADVETRLQRSADLLRQGYDPAGDSSDEDIPGDLDQLAAQVRAARAAAAGGPSPEDAALPEVERLRARLAALDPALGPRGQDGTGGARAGPDGQAGDAQAQGGARGGGAQAGGAPGTAGDDAAGTVTGGVRGAGGGRGGYVNGGWNFGNNVELPRGATPDAGPAPADREQAFSQGMQQLATVRRAVADDAAARAQVDDLIKAVQQLDPKRFPGNPDMVVKLYGEVQADVDRLELQLGRDPGSERTAVRGAESAPIPQGYQDAVAEYYRRLSSVR
ncbi:MAG TPA: hypothetical protein VMB48_11615 [Steroidobacteraceae bacterium]|nr:hypothetical protein [Steroidobacteraceae bacterium]